MNSDGLMEVAPGVLVYPCPNCGVFIEKTGGCSKVTCRLCRNTFRYPTTRAEDVFVVVVAVAVTLAIFAVFPMCVYGIRAYVYCPTMRITAYETTYGKVPVDVVTTKANLQMQIDALEKQKQALKGINPSAADEYGTCLLMSMVMLCVGVVIALIISLIPLRYLPGPIGRFVLNVAWVFND